MKGEILIAPVRGFCSGVERAIGMVERAVQEGPFPVRVLHEIVHNDHVVNSFRRRGVIFAEELDPGWHGGTLIFSAHGVSRSVEESARKMDVRLLDATCPLVKGIHRKAAELEAEGYSVVLIGKRSHREIEGVIGRLNHIPYVVENAADVEKIPENAEVPLACLTQTTLSMDDCAGLFDLLKKRIPRIRICGGICGATTARQRAVKQLAERCRTILVIGSVKSSNSRKLREVAESCGARALLIASADELNLTELPDGDIGVTSGASAPEYLLQETVAKLESAGWRRALPDGTEQDVSGPVSMCR